MEGVYCVAPALLLNNCPHFWYLQGMGNLYNKGVEQKDLSDAITTYCKLIMFSKE